jgi:hypothetical protein
VSRGWLERFWWLWPLAVFTATRAVNAVMISAASERQVALDSSIELYHVVVPTPADPGYFSVASNWDGQWYMDIALHGYPANASDPANETEQQSVWAFSPLFPFAVRVLMELTRQPFTVVAPLVATVCAAGGVVLLYRLIGETASTFAARATTLLLCTYIAAPALQISYTEGPALLLLTSAMLLLRRRRYEAAAATVALLGLTRPIALPFLAVVLAHVLCRLRDEDPPRGRDRWRLAALAAVSVLSVGLWPGITGLSTGRLAAFLDIQAAWGVNTSVLELARSSSTSAVVLLLLVVMLVLVVAHRGARLWGPELRTWAVAYPLYILAAAPAAISIPRLYLLAIPLMWPFPEQPRSPADVRLRGALVGVLAGIGLLSQWYWISRFLVLGPLKEQFGMP